MKEIFGKFKNQNQKLLNKVDEIKNDINNEKRGIYNVTFNNKNATPIKTDLEIIDFDRNLKQYKGYDRMKFQNPQVENYYINQTTQQRKKQ